MMLGSPFLSTVPDGPPSRNAGQPFFGVTRPSLPRVVARFTATAGAQQRPGSVPIEDTG